MSLTIATWNVNSITARLPHVLNWLSKKGPDVLLLQELKCITESFPFSDIEALGYHVTAHGQKAYNGVAILSRHPMEDISTGLAGDENDAQSRYIEATIKNTRIASIYLPNGNPVDTEKFSYKLNWMTRLKAHAKDLLKTGRPVILGGDFNIIPEPIDCYNPAVWENDALFRLESRKKWREILNLGYTDALRALDRHPERYTFWDYQAGAFQRNNGIRIDHFLLSPTAADRLQACVIDAEPRGLEKASDHTPVILTIKA